ncbi:MAG TPA: protein kinase, partial [Planctomycetota bacterium]|nr:protein kinase [Planctomycetota bacterium]
MGSPDTVLGQLLVRHLLARPEDVQAAIEALAAEKARGLPARSIGDILVERGVLTPAQLDLVLEEQKRGTRVGPYEILARLGEGGMGVVYKARSGGGSAVALKVLSRRFAGSPEVINRFRREAAIGQTLDHPHIVRTLDFGEDRGNHYIALELMEGGDLGRRLRQGGPLPERKALEIARQMALALDHAHARGLVHRDVKPSNIMFASDGTARLSDFGLVKSLDPEASRLTLEGSALGTPHYISPEQAMGEKDIDARADVYSLGATLYHVVTGQPPFDGGTPLEVIQKHLHEKLTPPDEIVPSLGDGCVAVIERMMAKER